MRIRCSEIECESRDGWATYGFPEPSCPSFSVTVSLDQYRRLGSPIEDRVMKWAPGCFTCNYCNSEAEEFNEEK